MQAVQGPKDLKFFTVVVHNISKHCSTRDFQHAFYRLNKTEVMIITPGKSVTMGDLKISKTDVKRAVAGQRSKKTKENKRSAV